MFADPVPSEVDPRHHPPILEPPDSGSGPLDLDGHAIGQGVQRDEVGVHLPPELGPDPGLVDLFALHPKPRRHRDAQRQQLVPQVAHDEAGQRAKKLNQRPPPR